MKVGFIVNEFASLGARQSTALLALALHEDGHEVGIATVADLGMDEHGNVQARTRRVAGLGGAGSLAEALDGAAVEVSALATFDLIATRTNPARDERVGLQACSQQLLEIASARGIAVLNDPRGLDRAASKAYLGVFPAFTRPRTICSGDRDTLREFVHSLDGPAVLKPALGTRGLGVFRADRAERNLNQILDLLLERGMVTAQEYVDAADDGDTRVLVIGGEVLRIDGVAAAIRRVPGRDDFRSNIHAGGHAEPGHVTPAMERVVEAIAPQLMRDGLFVVGLDFIGDVLCEANVFSPGGLFDLQRFTGLPFCQRLGAMMLDEAQRLKSRGRDLVAPPPGSTLVDRP